MRKKLILTVAGWVLFICALYFAVWKFTPAPPAPQSVQFADGSTCTFLGVSYGATNSYLVGKEWQKGLYKLLPPKFKSWSRARLITSGMAGLPTNCPTFWLGERSPQQPSAPQATRGWTAIDEFGCEYSESGGSYASSWISQDEAINYQQLEPNSPHGRVVAMAVYETWYSTNRLATFIVPGAKLPSPLPANIPPLARAQVGDIQVELLDLVTGLNCAAYPTNYPVSSNGTAMSQAIFSITKGSQPLPQWTPSSFRLTSRSGLVVRPRFRSWGRRDGNLVFNFEGTFDPAQGPWKFRLELIHESGFSSNELVDLPGVSVPAAGLTNQIGLQTNLLGETILVERAFGASNSPPASVISYFWPQPFLEVSVSPALPQAFHLRLAKAADEGGSNQNFSFYPGTDQGKYYFSLQPDPAPHLLNLTFALHASRFVEFEANPRVASGKETSK